VWLVLPNKCTKDSGSASEEICRAERSIPAFVAFVGKASIFFSEKKKVPASSCPAGVSPERSVERLRQVYVADALGLPLALEANLCGETADGS
jgi:hypothetical protein